MRDAVICVSLRTPVGAFGGSLRDVLAHKLAATVIRGLLERTGPAPHAQPAGSPVRPRRSVVPGDTLRASSAVPCGIGLARGAGATVFAASRGAVSASGPRRNS